MKAYPLIYSRTKLVDYVSGFLVRPSDLSADIAAKYVNKSLQDINSSGGIRHAVFPVGNYLVYGGVASASPILIHRIFSESKISELNYPYDTFQTDKSGRPIIFFIGFAIKREDILEAELPDIDLYKTYQIYLSYLKKQWDSVNTKTEIPNFIELRTITHDTLFHPDEVKWGNYRLVKNYNEAEYKKYIQYYFSEMIRNPSARCSFLSQVLSDNITTSYPFTCISISDCSVEKCIAKLNSKTQSPYSSTGRYYADESHPESANRENHLEDNPFMSTFKEYDPDARAKKKTNEESSIPRSLIFGLVVVLLITMLILLFSSLVGKAKAMERKMEEEEKVNQQVAEEVTAGTIDLYSEIIEIHPEEMSEKVIPDNQIAEIPNPT